VPRPRQGDGVRWCFLLVCVFFVCLCTAENIAAASGRGSTLGRWLDECHGQSLVGTRGNPSMTPAFSPQTLITDTVTCWIPWAPYLTPHSLSQQAFVCVGSASDASMRCCHSHIFERPSFRLQRFGTLESQNPMGSSGSDAPSHVTFCRGRPRRPRAPRLP
jgi:hypothetical protein